MFLSSLTGDSLILAASFKSNAFKINKLIVTVIQHIAVSDLAFSIFHVLPVAISLLANSWMFGNFICFVTVYASYLAYSAGLIYIAILTAIKFLILKYPLRITNWSIRRVHQVCSSIWALCLIWPVLMIAVDRDDVQFDYRPYKCGYKHTAEIWRILWPTLGSIFSFAPNVVIVSTSIPTLKYLAAARKSAKQVKGSVPRQGALAVALTAIVYTIASLPYVVYQVAVQFVQYDCSARMITKVYQITSYMLSINTMANFYIYALTIRTFRRYLFSKVLSVIPVSWQTTRERTSTTGTYQIT